MRTYDWRQGEADLARQAEEAATELRSGGAKVRAEVRAEVGPSFQGTPLWVRIILLVAEDAGCRGLSTCPDQQGHAGQMIPQLAPLLATSRPCSRPGREAAWLSLCLPGF